MGRFSRYIGSQFGNPRGFIGKCCCVIMNVINNAMYKKIIHLINATEETIILDIGYGNAYLTKLIYKKYKSNIYGIDISEDMKHLAIKRNRKGVLDKKIHFEVGDCCAMPYDNSFFDNVVSINTIYFWQNTLKGLEEINRTLKPNGSFYNVVYTKEWLKKLSYTRVGFKFFEKEDFIRLGKETGFSNVEIRDISKGKSFVVIYKK